MYIYIYIHIHIYIYIYIHNTNNTNHTCDDIRTFNCLNDNDNNINNAHSNDVFAAKLVGRGRAQPGVRMASPQSENLDVIIIISSSSSRRA